MPYIVIDINKVQSFVPNKKYHGRFKEIRCGLQDQQTSFKTDKN